MVVDQPRKAVIGMAGRARPSWAETLLAPIRELWEGPRAEALVALIPRVAPGRRAPLFEEAVRAAQGYQVGAAPKRRSILSSLAPELTRLPPAQLARIWADDMHIVGLRGRSEVLVDVAALADPWLKSSVLRPQSRSMTLSKWAERIGGLEAVCRTKSGPVPRPLQPADADTRHGLTIAGPAAARRDSRLQPKALARLPS